MNQDNVIYYRDILIDKLEKENDVMDAGFDIPRDLINKIGKLTEWANVDKVKEISRLYEDI